MPRGIARLAGALAALLAFSTLSPVVGEFADLPPLEQREHLLERFRQDRIQAVPRLLEALDAETPFVRRTAAHLLVRAGEPAAGHLEAALGNEDFEVRAIAARGMAEMGLLARCALALLHDDHHSIRHLLRMILLAHPMPEGEERDAFFAKLGRMYEGAPEDARKDAVELLASVKSPGGQGQRLLLRAAADESPPIRTIAYTRLFETADLQGETGRDIVLAAKADPSFEIREKGHRAAGTYDSTGARERDFQAEWGRRPAASLPEDRWRTVQETPLPAEGWKFRLDRTRTGHEKGWFRPGHDDEEWLDAEIEAFWHEFINYLYVGVGWYRRTFEAPERPGEAAFILHFGAVDESAWVWVNGEFAGHHHVGGVGWNQPFYLDVSDLIQPGAENHIAVRAMNTAGGGGVWRPVRLLAVEEP